MKYLLIENKGELDINSLVLVGASTKRGDDNKIGMFGSGNKYAIATLIKNKIPFKIYSGEREVEIKTKPIEFREQKFEQIFIDGKATSLTSDMGPQWEPWMAIREFVSNSLDEGSSNIVTSIEGVYPREGFTRIYILHCEPIDVVINNWSKYFSFDRTDVECEKSNGRILKNNNLNNELVLYRRGIRCISSTSTKSLFHYDLSYFNINESRVLSSGFGYYEVSGFVALNATLEIASTILTYSCKRENDGKGIAKYYEAGLYYDYHTLNVSWRQAIGNKTIVVDNLSGFFIDTIKREPCYIVPFALAKAIKKSFSDVKVLGIGENGDESSYKIVEETNKIRFLLKEAEVFFKEIHYSLNHLIKIVSFSEEDKMSQSGMGMILLSERLFEQGKRQIVSEIIKINEILNTRKEPRSEGIENHFINMFLSEKEERYCHFL